MLAINAEAWVGILRSRSPRRGRRDDFRHLGRLLAADAYDAFRCRYIKAVLKRLRDEDCRVPTIVFTKGGGNGWTASPHAVATP